MIDLYIPSNTNYEQNGDITLLPGDGDIHVILNGQWSAELTHPIDTDGRWKLITENAVVKMPSFNGDQLFRIVSVEKTDSEVTAEMQPIFFDCIGDCWLSDVRPTDKTGLQALQIMLAPNSKYSAQSDITVLNTAYYQNVNFMEALNGDIDQSFINRWGGEISFNNYTVIVNNRIGDDYGMEVRYGLNTPVDGFTYSVDMSEVATRIYPQAYNGRQMTGTGYVDSPLINSYPIVHSSQIVFDDVRLAEDMNTDDTDGLIICQTQADLNAALQQKCEEQFTAGIDKPKVQIKIDMVMLQNTVQYADIKDLVTVGLGDTIHCFNQLLGITTDARVIELHYNPILKTVESVVIGDFEPQYFDTVTSQAQKIEAVIAPNGSVMADKVQGILNGMYTQLRLQYTAAEPIEGDAYLFENLDPSSALYGAMSLGTQGLQISRERSPDGRSWNWTTSISAEGINASTVITGLLTDKLGNFYLDMDTGQLAMKNGTFSGTITASSISGGSISGTTITGGSISGGTITGGTISGTQISGSVLQFGSAETVTLQSNGTDGAIMAGTGSITMRSVQDMLLQNTNDSNVESNHIRMSNAEGNSSFEIYNASPSFSNVNNTLTGTSTDQSASMSIFSQYGDGNATIEANVTQTQAEVILDAKGHSTGGSANANNSSIRLTNDSSSPSQNGIEMSTSGTSWTYATEKIVMSVGNKISVNGAYHLDIQSDGNVVLFNKSGQVIWQTGTAGM